MQFKNISSDMVSAIYYKRRYYMESKIFNIDNMVREQFMRIANAQLKGVYKFGPQRIAVAAVMFRRWVERKERTSNTVK